MAERLVRMHGRYQSGADEAMVRTIMQGYPNPHRRAGSGSLARRQEMVHRTRAVMIEDTGRTALTDQIADPRPSEAVQPPAVPPADHSKNNSQM